MCDYCPAAAVFLAFAWNGTTGATRLACHQHHDQARADCTPFGPPTISELHPQETRRD